MNTREPTVYVVVPVFNRVADTARFVECLRLQEYKRWILVIADDCSTDGTSEYLATRAPEVVVLNGNGDLWWTGGTNLCLEYVLERCHPEDLVLTINNDVVIGKDYIAQKVNRAKEFPGSIIGSVCVYENDPDLIETSGLVMNFSTCLSRPIVPTNTKLSKSGVKGCVPATHLPGKGVLVPVSIYKTIGLYDYERMPHYHADTDFTLRAWRSGVRIYVDFQSIVHSCVNYANLIRGEDISLSGFLKTFNRRSGINSFPVKFAFAAKHFARRRWQYLFVNYFMAIGGVLRRYLYAQLRRVFAK